MIGFICGIFVGFFAGVLAMGILTMGKISDEDY